ncbi:MAG: hypothetical protein EBE86_003120 [Hormoscilla sp. GUM202]|nr:hypothetical protein [Hormoscilla sp. GUM202]
MSLTEEKASEIMLAVEPVLESIENHMGRKIIQQDQTEDSALQQVFGRKVPGVHPNLAMSKNTSLLNCH